MKRLLLLLIIFLSIKLSGEEKKPFFIPPKDWALLDPSSYSQYIKAIFVKKDKSIFRPNINLSIQETDLSLDEYTNEAKRAHEKDPSITYTILGKIDFKEDKASLSEVSVTLNSIDFKILQFILVKNKNAYIITGACKKGEITEYYPIIINSFKSFELIEDLFSKVSSESKKNALVKKYSSLIAILKKSNDKQIKKNLVSFEKYLDKNYQNEGKYFSMLLLEKALKEIKD